MTYSQLCQVLRMYTAHSNSRVMVMLWLLLHVCFWVAGFLGQVQGRQQLPPMMIALLLVSNLMLARMLSGMLELQFANLQARLAPAYAGAHLVVAGGIAGTAIAIEAVLVSAWMGPTGLLAQISLSVLAIGGGVWIAYSRSTLGSGLYTAAICVSFVAPTYVEAVVLTLGERPVASLGIACIGLAAMAALGTRLWMFREEVPEYPRQLAIDRDLTSWIDDRSRQRFEAQVIARSWTRGWLRDVQFRLVLRGSTATSPWRRLLLRQVVNGFPCLSAMAMVFVYILFIFLFQSWRGRSFGGDNGFLLSFFPLLMALIVQVVSWDRCWPYLARELLRPVGRKDFIGDLARFMAFDMAGAAAVHCAMLVVWLKLLSPLGTAEGLLLPWLVLTMAQYAVAYCLMFWLLTSRNVWGLILGFAAACLIPTVMVHLGLSLAEHNQWSPLGLAAAIIVTILAMASLYHIAFRRWCCADLD